MFRLPAQRLAAVLVILLSCLALPLPDAAAQSREPRARTNQDAGRDEEPDPLAFAASGHTFHGDWQAQVVVSRRAWRPLQRIQVDVTLNLAAGHLASLASANVKADKFCVLVTAERTFDATGWLRLPSDERMSTLLTPAGLAIEGGVQGAVTDRYGYPYKSPVDLFASLPVSAAKDGPNGTRQVVFSFDSGLPPGLPPGLYRLRIDAGVMVGSRLYNINGFSFAVRPSTPEAGTVTYFYSPLLTASGQGASGGHVDADRIKPRFPWLLLAGYNSNGYRGVVAEEDRARFATSDRNLIPDEVVLPMYDDNGNRIGYSLEPQFPADSIDQYQNIGWDYGSGQLSVRVAGPDGSLVDLGTASFVAKSGNGATTRNTAFTGWKPQGYGRYTVTATGWIADREGRRYQGGGTYRFWIAKRMTLATATFQGQPYPVGSTYGRDIQFNPAVPADVQVTAKLFVDSDVSNVRMLSYTGKASPAGLYGAAQGMKAFPLDAPGEYHAQVLATYTDADGHLWVSVMRHAGVVYPASSPVIARGKKFSVGGKYVERGETRFEGYVEENGEQHLAHITFPYLAGDMLLIGTEGQGANKIEPVLTYQAQGDTSAWDTKLNGVGTTNLSIKTSNWYSPHLYPEYITDIEYYYGAAPRPGFMGRFLVGESTVRAPYWPVSPNSFGGQIGASPNGDSVGDIYRLLGGVVLRPAGKSPMYAGYMANAFLLPKGTNNNRVAAPGSEDLVGPLGERARFFLVGLRPGTSFELGSTFRPALQIDPMLPAAIEFTLTYPDGRRQTATGVGDASGSFAGPAAWPLDVPGIYRYQVRATWNGFHAGMPGLPEGGGHFFVYSKTRPAGAAGLRIDGASQRTFAASAGTTISGTSSAATVHYTLITPGAVIEQGEIPVKGGRFSYAFSPAAVNAKVPIYDIRSITTGQPQLGRVLHLTFFAEEKSGGGSFFDVARVILRGSTAIAARGAIPVSAPLSAAVPSGAASVPGLSVGIAAGSAATTTRVGLAASGSDPDFLRAWDERVRALERHGGLRVASTEPDTLVGSRVHERLQQDLRRRPHIRRGPHEAGGQRRDRLAVRRPAPRGGSGHHPGHRRACGGRGNRTAHGRGDSVGPSAHAHRAAARGRGVPARLDGRGADRDRRHSLLPGRRDGPGPAPAERAQGAGAARNPGSGRVGRARRRRPRGLDRLRHRLAGRRRPTPAGRERGRRRGRYRGPPDDRAAVLRDALRSARPRRPRNARHCPRQRGPAGRLARCRSRLASLLRRRLLGRPAGGRGRRPSRGRHGRRTSLGGRLACPRPDFARAGARRDGRVVATGLPRRGRRVERGVRRHDGDRGGVCRRCRCGGLPGGRGLHGRHRHPVAAAALAPRSAGSLRPPRGHRGRPRRRAHEFHDRRPRVLPRDRGRHQRHVRPRGRGRRTRSARPGRTGLLPGVRVDAALRRHLP